MNNPANKQEKLPLRGVLLNKVPCRNLKNSQENTCDDIFVSRDVSLASGPGKKFGQLLFSKSNLHKQISSILFSVITN